MPFKATRPVLGWPLSTSPPALAALPAQGLFLCVLWILGAHSHLRALVLAVPCAWKTFPISPQWVFLIIWIPVQKSPFQRHLFWFNSKNPSQMHIQSLPSTSPRSVFFTEISPSWNPLIYFFIICSPGALNSAWHRAGPNTRPWNGWVGWRSVLHSIISNSKKREEPTVTINGGLLHKLQFFYTMEYYVTVTKKKEYRYTKTFRDCQERVQQHCKIQKSTVFLCTSSENSKMKLRKQFHL